MIIRKAELKDAALLSETRKLQLIDEGIAPDCDIDSELDAFFKKWLVSKDFLQLIAEEDGKLLSTAAVIYYDLPPSYTNKIGVRGYVTNVYTAPEHRSRWWGYRDLHCAAHRRWYRRPHAPRSGQGCPASPPDPPQSE